MEISVEKLKDRPLSLAFDEPVAAFPVLAQLVAEGALALPGGISARLVAQRVGDLVEVEGTLALEIVQPCSRCLQPAVQPLSLDVAFSYVREAAPAADADEERELTEAEVGLIGYAGDAIDLRDAVEQEILMAFPQHPLCRSACAGLCPVCGADQNVNRCDCERPVFHGGFAALRDFKVTER